MLLLGQNLDSGGEAGTWLWPWLLQGTRPFSQHAVNRGLVLDLVSSFPPHPLEFSRNEGKVSSNKRMWCQSFKGYRHPQEVGR